MLTFPLSVRDSLTNSGRLGEKGDKEKRNPK